MKRIILLVLISFIVACSNDTTDFIQPITHSFQVSYSDSYNNLIASNTEITLANNEDGKTYTVTTNANGIAAIELVPGNYKVNASKVFTAEEFLDFFGQEVDTDISFNASLEALNITESTTDNTELKLVSGRIGNLIIKQVYFSGSDVKLGALYRDQFFEIYNNSNEQIYLDGLCFAQIYGTNSVSSNLNSYHLPNGQYDWSQSLNQSDPSNANTNYIYSDEVIQFPGTGEQYPLASRKSVIVAATAVNHKSPLTVIDDEGEQVVYEVPEPDRTIDLSAAPFEAYYRPYQESKGSSYLDSDIDNPNAVNMDIVFKSSGGKDLILDTFGRDAFVIFNATNEEINSWSALPLPSITSDKYTETTKTYLQIPVSVIIDGVETQRNDPSKGKPKRLVDAIDAGEIATIQGKFSSESVIRKSKTINGIVIYQDTNNSSNDFEVLAHPQVIID